jgi:hypothetical protein
LEQIPFPEHARPGATLATTTGIATTATTATATATTTAPTSTATATTTTRSVGDLEF